MPIIVKDAIVAIVIIFSRQFSDLEDRVVLGVPPKQLQYCPRADSICIMLPCLTLLPMSHSMHYVLSF